jgi:hypothetical protein
MKHYTQIDENIRLDFKMIFEGRKITYFAINVAIIDDGMEDVFRIDTAHKGLHMMKFWVSPEPKYLERAKKGEYNHEFNEWKKDVLKNYKRWVDLYKRSRKK